MPVQSEALPTSPLDPKAFVRDPCAFASAAAMASFLPFIESELAQTREELSGRGRCIYRAKRPETTIDILFGPTKPLRANEELRNIKGVAGVKVRALAEVAEVSIPFPAAAIPDAPAADRVKLRVELHPGRTRGRARPKGPPPDPDALEKVALGMARNLIERLDIES